MPSPGRQHLFRLRVRRVTVAACALCYLAAAVGFPMAVQSGKDASAGSAGQGRACGCAADDQCNGTCCCCKPAVASPAEEEPACCGHERSSCCSHPERETTQAPAPFRWVIGQQWQQCRGLALAWVSLGAAPPPAPVAVPLDLTSRDLVSPTNFMPRTTRSAPPAPPPRPTQASSQPAPWCHAGTARVACAPVSTGGTSAS